MRVVIGGVSAVHHVTGLVGGGIVGSGVEGSTGVGPEGAVDASAHYT